MKQLIWILFLGFILASGPTWADGGSRVGNGNGNGNGSFVSSNGNFEIQLPSNFQTDRKLEDGIRLQGLPIFVKTPGSLSIGAQTMKPQTLNVLDLSKEVPDIKDLNKDQVAKWLNQHRYQILPTESRCVIARTVKRNGLSTTIVQWGKNQGITISSEQTPTTDRSVDEILRSLKIYKGECAW